MTPDLTAFAARLLAGTGLDPDAAVAFARDGGVVPNDAATAAASIRAGWATTDHAKELLP